jgi:DNA-binding winged helix-turn-helix (wHTH) protein
VRLTFGTVTFDSETRQVWLAEEEVRLSPKAFDLLALLIARRPKAVSKADIHDHLWPGTYVSDSSLPSLVSEIRGAIADHQRDPGLVRTLHGFGYAFQAEGPSLEQSAVDAGNQNGWLVSTAGEIALFPGENIVGREGRGVVLVKSSTVSRRHARIVIEANGAVVEDLGSKNGTFVNDRTVTGPTPVVNGDQIRFGSLLFTFRLSQAGESTVTRSSQAGTPSGP